jgi:hypothetical protein
VNVENDKPNKMIEIGSPIPKPENSASDASKAVCRRPGWLWPAGLAATALLLIYLWQVFMAAFVFSTYHDVSVKPGRALPYYPSELQQECVPVFEATTMTPYADKDGVMHRFPEFQERGSFWLLDSAMTGIYDVELLKHPRCLQFMLQRIAAIKDRQILVIYDKATKSDVLVVRNY